MATAFSSGPLEPPVTLEAVLDLAHHITGSFLMDRPTHFLPLVGGIIQNTTHLQVLQCKTPICNMDFLRSVQRHFQEISVDRYFYVTSTVIHEPALGASDNARSMPAIFTMAVMHGMVRVRYLTFDVENGLTNLHVKAEHHYHDTAHFAGPYSQLLSQQDLTQLPEPRPNYSLH